MTATHTGPVATTSGAPVDTAASTAAGRQGAKDAAPFAVALIPFGIAIGGAASSSGLSAAEAIFGAATMLAGAAQLAAIESITSGRGVFGTAAVVILINLRFVFYGAGVKGWFAEASRRRQLLLVGTVVDQTFLLCIERFTNATNLAWRQRYYLSVTAVLVASFLGSQLVALHFASSLPDSLGLHLAAPLAFVGMLGKTIASRPELTAGTVASAFVLLAAPIVGPAALPLGVVAGVATAKRSAGEES